MRRHWITTFLAWLYFATAIAGLYSLWLWSLGANSRSAPLSVAVWRLLGLFPTPAVISWLVNLVLSFISPALVASRANSIASCAMTLVLSVALGVAIFRMRSWARAALIAVCVLTLGAQLYTLSRIVFYSPGLLTVLQSNFRGASAGYVSGAGPGSILASVVIAIGLFWFLIRHGLPSVDAGATELRIDSGPNGTKGRRAHQFLLYAIWAALLLQVLVLFVGLEGRGYELTKTRLLLCVLLVPNVLILIRSWREPDRLSLGLATGYGLLVGYVGALFLPTFLFGLAWIIASPQSGGLPAYLLLEILPVLQFSAAIGAVITTRHLSPVPANSQRLGLWGAAFLVPLVVGTAFPQFYFDWQGGNLPVPGVKSWGDEYKELQKNDATARDLVRKYGYCAFLYAKLHPEDGFPTSVDLMGPGGIGCLSHAEATGNLDGYSFRYKAEKSEGAGQFDRFTAAAQMNNHRQIDGVLMNEKGVLVLVTSQEIQSQLVTADQLSWDTPKTYKTAWVNTSSSMLPKIVSCAKTLREHTGDFPATLVEVLRVKMKETDSDCINVYPAGDPYLQAAAGSNRAAYAGQVLEYEPQRDASGKIVHILVTLRPERYAIDGIRSYLIDDAGALHATSEDRSATTDDLAPLGCEIGGACSDE